MSPTLVSRLLIGVGQERGDPGVGRQGCTPAGWVGDLPDCGFIWLKGH